ncbi:hypothetical protein DY000_02053380 [Brassica cretica]|uniref:Uncharacterized protein n=1 Tax=Brassica cretica TaxID=69181 RepID=A0ABQ7AL86_BRACR|nr:hypothetical protein DY000_02053380 [Brassica cretica]
MATATALIGDGDGDCSPSEGNDREKTRTISDLVFATLEGNTLGAQESGVVENGDGQTVVETSKGLDFAAGEESGATLARSMERSSPWKKKQHDGVVPEASIEITNGVSSMEIPNEIFDEAELLWTSYVVGYFIGDVPHVGATSTYVPQTEDMAKRT